jgi:hypothetical protein
MWYKQHLGNLTPPGLVTNPQNEEKFLVPGKTKLS